MQWRDVGQALRSSIVLGPMAEMVSPCRAFGVSETCYRYGPKLRAENEEIADLLTGLTAVFVKQVVRRFHAASLISGALISVSGLSQTGPAGCQLRVSPDQRSGFCARAFA